MTAACLLNSCEQKENCNVSPDLRDELELELAQLRELLERFQALFQEVTSRVPTETEKLALAAILHTFYTGVENIFKPVAIHIDGSLPKGENWHRQLLDSMSQSHAARPAVISESLRQTLRGYLDFRHVFRNAYSFDLQWEKMAGLILACIDQDVVVCEITRRMGAELRVGPGKTCRRATDGAAYNRSTCRGIRV